MPQYEFRCRSCAKRFVLFYKTFADYDAASTQCIDCDSSEVTRIITQVAIGNSNRDYSKMSSQEMLSVMESGDKQQVDTLFRQVGETSGREPSPSPGERKGDDTAARQPSQSPDSDRKSRPDSG